LHLPVGRVAERGGDELAARVGLAVLQRRDLLELPLPVRLAGLGADQRLADLFGDHLLEGADVATLGEGLETGGLCLGDCLGLGLAHLGHGVAAFWFMGLVMGVTRRRRQRYR